MTREISNTDIAWYVYIIETRCTKLYTGITTNLERRYEEHKEMFETKKGKGAKYFRAHEPAKLVWSSAYSDRSTASAEEYRIKKLSAKQKRALISKR